MITDWKQEIAKLWLVKQAMMEFDSKRMYPYHLPEVAASERDLAEVEERLGFALDSRYRLFLQYANGWHGFLQKTDLFGTSDLIQGTRHQTGEFILSFLDDRALRASHVRRSELLPIAASTADRDLCVMMRPESSAPGAILWFGGEEIDRFPTFDDYFLAMVDYNRLELQRFKEERAGRPPALQ